MTCTASCKMHQNGQWVVVTYEARTRMEAINWLRFNRDYATDFRIDGSPISI